MVFYNNTVFIVSGSFLIFILFTLDIATWVMGFTIRESSIPCSQTLCLDIWLILSGMISMYLNFFRLWDLGHLYVAMGDPMSIGFTHFICRITCEIIIIIFHISTIISGIFIIFILHTADDSFDIYGYQRDYMYDFVIIITCGHVCYIFISLFITYLKYTFLRQPLLEGAEGNKA